MSRAQRPPRRRRRSRTESSSAEAGRREPEAAAERAREVRSLAVADQARDVRNGDRRLLDQQLGRRRHAAREKILAEADLAELLIRALQLTGRAGKGPRDDG